MSTNEPLTISEAADALGLPKATLRHILQRPDRRARLLHAYRNTKKGLKTVELVPLDLLEELSRNYPPVDGPHAADSEDSDGLTDEQATDVSSTDNAGTDQAAVTIEMESIELTDDSDESTAANAPLEIVDGGVADHGHHLPPADADSPADTEANESHSQTSLAEPVAAAEIKLGSVNQQTGDAMMIVATYERLLAEREARLLEIHAALESERANGRRIAETLASTQKTLLQVQESLALVLQRPVSTVATPEDAPLPPASMNDRSSESAGQTSPQVTRGFWGRLFSR